MGMVYVLAEPPRASSCLLILWLAADDEDAYVWYGEEDMNGQHDTYSELISHDAEADESAQMWMESVQASHAEADSVAEQQFEPSSWPTPAEPNAAQQAWHDSPQTAAHGSKSWSAEQQKAWWHWHQAMQHSPHGPTHAVSHAAQHEQHMQSSQAAQGSSHSMHPATAGNSHRVGSQSSLPPGSDLVLVPASLLRRYQELEWAEWRRRYSEWQTAYESYSQWYQHYAQWQEYQSHQTAPVQQTE